eukprot:Hpha_TRINITY_DN16723_c1_g1::TRINITY_DN16723_c1_g1_i14::g.77146::m.77146
MRAGGAAAQRSLVKRTGKRQASPRHKRSWRSSSSAEPGQADRKAAGEPEAQAELEELQSRLSAAESDAETAHEVARQLLKDKKELEAELQAMRRAGAAAERSGIADSEQPPQEASALELMMAQADLKRLRSELDDELNFLPLPVSDYAGEEPSDAEQLAKEVAAKDHALREALAEVERLRSKLAADRDEGRRSSSSAETGQASGKTAREPEAPAELEELQSRLRAAESEAETAHEVSRQLLKDKKELEAELQAVRESGAVTERSADAQRPQEEASAKDRALQE